MWGNYVIMSEVFPYLTICVNIFKKKQSADNYFVVLPFQQHGHALLVMSHMGNKGVFEYIYILFYLAQYNNSQICL